MEEFDIDDFLDALLSFAKAGGSVDEFKQLRSVLRKPEFCRAFRETLQRLDNQIAERDLFFERIGRVEDALADLLASQKSDRAEIELIAIGGGSTLSTGAVIAAFSLGQPYLAVPIIAAGGYSAYRGLRERRSLAAKIAILDTIILLFGECAGPLRRLEHDVFE